VFGQGRQCRSRRTAASAGATPCRRPSRSPLRVVGQQAECLETRSHLSEKAPLTADLCHLAEDFSVEIPEQNEIRFS